MSIGRVLGLLVLILVLYAVISQPLSSAATVREGASHLGSAGSSVVVFFQSLVPGTSSYSTTAGSVDYVPVGGAAAGDGSSAP